MRDTASRPVNDHQEGTGTLEAGLVLLVLLPFLLAAFALIDYLQEKNRLIQIIDKHLYGDAFKPYSQDADSFQPMLDSNGFKNFLQKTAADLAGELKRPDSRGDMKFFLQAGFAEISLDPLDGSVQQLSQLRLLASEGAGGFIPPALLEKTDLPQQFEHAVNQLLDGRGRFVWSAPNALSAGNDRLIELYRKASGAQLMPHSYREKVVLVGLRAFIQRDSSLISAVAELIGLEPLIYSCKVIVLRGDYDL